MPSARKRDARSPTPPAAGRAAPGTSRPSWLVAAGGAALVILLAAFLSFSRGSVSFGSRKNQALFGQDQFHDANVLLVTIDTLRVDRVGAYGGPKGLTPTLDRLAANGIRFARARSHAPMTLPAHTSILTGLTPLKSGVRNNTSFRLDERVPTMATFLKGAGYRTAAFVGAFVLDARFGLARDFDTYDDRIPHLDRASFQFAERRAAEVVKAAGDWITGPASPGSRPRPWFAWVHLFDPHAPYDAPMEYRPGRSPYDAEVAYTDAMLGSFLDRLRLARALDHTLIVVTADHGESLGEHGETTHGLFAYEATIHVPLILDTPAARSGVVDAPVGHVDILPTILDLVGTKVSSGAAGLEGRSLLRPAPPDRPVYFEALDASLTRGWAPLTGIVQDGWKYIDLPDAELYDLSTDPREQHNLAGRSSRVDTMRRALAGVLASSGGTSASSGGISASPGMIGETAAPATPLDADAAARLRALGYVGNAAAAPHRGRASRRTYALADDPKRLVTLNEQFNSALTAFDEGRSSEALSILTAVLRARPDFTVARTGAATVLLSERRGRDAVQLLRNAPESEQDAPELLEKLGAALRDAGDLRGAASTLERARDVGDRNLSLLEDLGVTYARLGRVGEARALFTDLTVRDPSATTVWYNLGLLELQNSRPKDAAAALRQAVSLEPFYGDAWHALGAALVNMDPAGAIDAWRHAEPLLPHDYDLLFNLGMLSAQSNRPAEALPYLQRFVREAPRERYARDIRLVQQTLTRLERGAP